MDGNKKYWVALNLVLSEHLGETKKVLDRFSRIEDVFKSSKEDLISLGVKRKRAERLSSPQLLNEAERVIKRAEEKQYSILTWEDEAYPAYLREIFDPPAVLYCVGQAEVLNDPSVAVVGTRRASPYGRIVAEKLAEDLALREMVVVSGLARGIDSAAHRGALRAGKTIAVLGSGLENIYPRENRKLFKSITKQGAVISEFPLDSPPLGLHFPIRNRIISGLSLALVVVEAARKSGSLISARLALEYNREVMAVPGNVTSELSKGTNWLLKSGAKPVETWQDVIEEFPSPLREKVLSKKEEKKKSSVSLSREENELFALLKPDSLTHIDEILEKTNFSVSEVLSIMLSLELKGIVFQSPGKYFQRRW